MGNLDHERIIEKLQEKDFHHAAIYFEDPVVYEGLTLNDVIALAFMIRTPALEDQDEISFLQRKIDRNSIPEIQLHAVETLGDLLRGRGINRPPHFEEARILEHLAADSQPKTRFDGPTYLDINKRLYVNTHTSFHHLHFASLLTPFPTDATFYGIQTGISPVRALIEIASKERTPERMSTVSGILEKLVWLHSQALNKTFVGRREIYIKSDVSQLTEAEKIKHFKSTGFGYRDVLPDPITSEEYTLEIQNGSDTYARFVSSEEIEQICEFRLDGANQDFANSIRHTFIRMFLDSDPVYISELRVGTQKRLFGKMIYDNREFF